MNGHARDVWVDVTVFGDPEPRLLLAVDGRELDIAEAKTAYTLGRIDADELENRVAEALAA